jgi:hypothetical protein
MGKNLPKIRERFSLIGCLVCAFYLVIFGDNLAAQALPSATELLARATAKPHPRAIDVVALRAIQDWDNRWSSADWIFVNRQYMAVLPTEPPVGTPPSTLQSIASGEEDSILLAAALWLRTGNPAAAFEVKRRALNLASWAPSGTTGYLSHDQSGRSVTRALTLAYDWLYGQWTEDEQKRLLSAIKPRVLDILSNGPYGLDNGQALVRQPYDSHRSVTTAHTALICSVLAGKDSVYDQCLTNILPGYLARPIPWGINDGGYANGTEYAKWDMQYAHFGIWEMLNQIVGVNLWKTSWALNHGKYLTYFLPPGTPSGAFGDAAERNSSNVWATEGKTYAAYLPSPLADWYARNLMGEWSAQLALLLAPQRDMSRISTSLPSGTAHGIHIPSIGWVAMHSDLGNLSRISVYMKSSPYGSYNHSHADQNSFVIHADGKILAADSGYYDDYNSPHWKGWYKATRAHNAITFDGQQGQMHDTMAAKGVIAQFVNTPKYDLVTGDARAAYGGKLTKAVRSMVYLRPNTLVVFDMLASDTPRIWEWNIHTLNMMKIKDARNIEINQGGVRMCVRQVAGPDVIFSQTDKFTVAPAGIFPNQWHGTFSSTVKSMDAIFITVLEVGCGNTLVTVTGNSKGHDVTVMGSTFSFDGAAILKK